MSKPFTQDWTDWLNTNLANKQNKDGLFKILLDEGFSFETIAQQMQYTPNVPVAELVNPFNTTKQLSDDVKEVNTAEESKLFIPNAMRLQSNLLELYKADNFLAPVECDYIVNLIKSKLRPSELTTAEADTSFRTSRTCDLGVIDDPFMRDIDDRLCRVMGIDHSYSEVLQGQYYEVGQQFKPHTDYFESHEMAKFGAKMGQRTYTLMIYLNDVEQGGETNFDVVNESIQATSGTAVIWNNLYPNKVPNPASQHCGMPVIKGYKAVITKWFRLNSQLQDAPPMWNKDKNQLIPNLTPIGFRKARLPKTLFHKLKVFYQQNRLHQKDEYVPGDFIVNLDKKSKSSGLIELTAQLREQVHDTLKPMLETWCGHPLSPTYVYGIRNYQHGAVLKMHRDRIDTHIISAVLNIDQEVNEDWPLVIEDHFYRTYKVILMPGEMVFYEGARLLHGRPIPFEGTSYANVFCHFQPRSTV